MKLGTLWIAEYEALQDGFPVEPALNVQIVEIRGEPTSSAPIHRQARFLRLHADVDCCRALGALTPMAMRLAADVPEVMAIRHVSEKTIVRVIGL